MTEEEKKKILDQHKKLEKETKERKDVLKSGLKAPEKKEASK